MGLWGVMGWSGKRDGGWDGMGWWIGWDGGWGGVWDGMVDEMMDGMEWNGMVGGGAWVGSQ